MLLEFVALFSGMVEGNVELACVMSSLGSGTGSAAAGDDCKVCSAEVAEEACCVSGVSRKGCEK